MKILVTGGMGYIGSHTIVELIKEGHTPIIFDNLANSNVEVLNRIKTLTKVKPMFYHSDLLNEEAIEEVFKENNVDYVIHFAGLKAVGQSTNVPLMYYENNIVGTINLLKVMKKYDCKNIIFSSSATVYGDVKNIAIDETFPTLDCTSPYGKTKLYIENILKDIHKSDNFNVVILRYFNPIGAHDSGLIGENPNDIPNNLVPYITQVAIGKREYLSVYGNDYDTIDGTGVRDYIHVVDLAIGHIKALEKIKKDSGLFIYNLGTGSGHSVLQVLEAFNQEVGFSIPYKIVNRRPGDVDTSFTKVDKALNELNFKATKDLKTMAKDSWNWQKNNPKGYEK